MATFPVERLDMKNSHIAEFLKSKEGRSVSRETAESLRLLKLFVKLTPVQRQQILELIESYLDH
jgi:hypothetical protein